MYGKDAWVIISGVGGVLGSSIASFLGEHGFKVIGLGRRDVGELNCSLTNLIDQGKLIYRKVDLLESSQIENFFKFAEIYNPVCLVNNAGNYGPMGNLDKICLTEWVRSFQLNFLCHVTFTKFFLNLRKRDGIIINISGGGATKPMEGLSCYAASKTALIRFTENIALEFSDRNFLCLAIAPGFLQSPFHLPIIENRSGLSEQFVNATKEKWDNPDDPTKTAHLILKIIERKADHLNGKLVSSIFDNWASDEIGEDPDFGTLRRIDNTFYSSKHL